MKQQEAFKFAAEHFDGIPKRLGGISTPGPNNDPVLCLASHGGQEIITVYGKDLDRLEGMIQVIRRAQQFPVRKSRT